MSVARLSHTAVLLPNGKVLVAGGADTNDINLASAELYDPSTRLWTNTGSMAVARFHNETITLRNGKVLVAGGFDDAGDPLLSAELYDPNNGVWSPAVGIGGAATASVLLPDGRALLLETQGSVPAAEIYDPASGAWTSTDAPGTNHFNALLLQNGKVLAPRGTVADEQRLCQ
jgi:hypothetical protein